MRKHCARSRGDEWITLPVRVGDHAVRTVHGAIRVPTVIVAVNFAKVPKKRPKLSAKNIRERDGNRCQYTGRLLHPTEGSLDHVVPRSRGGADTWENLVWSAKDVNQRKADRLPHEGRPQAAQRPARAEGIAGHGLPPQRPRRRRVETVPEQGVAIEPMGERASKLALPTIN
ncbi:MAG: HNH endonuclease [Limisphaerales bacterium]